MPSVLVTGANRGIGLEFVKQYLRAGWTVHACCRNPQSAEALEQLRLNDRLFVHLMDVSNQQHIDAVANELQDESLDLLINNAGITDSSGLGLSAADDSDITTYDFDYWEECLKVNLMGPARVTGAFRAQLKKTNTPRVVMIGSGLSSISNTWMAGRYAYRTSKAALNMLMRGLGAWLEPEGIALITIGPGWTQTDMGGPDAKTPVDETVHGMRAIIDRITLKETGTFWRWDGSELPW